MKDAKKIKKKRKNQNKQSNGLQINYQQAKDNRKNPEINKIKPTMGGSYPGNWNTYIYQNPLFEQHLSQYMEDTQLEINDVVTLEQFRSIVWKKGIPSFMVDLLKYVTGLDEELTTMFSNSKQAYNQLSYDYME